MITGPPPRIHGTRDNLRRPARKSLCLLADWTRHGDRGRNWGGVARQVAVAGGAGRAHRPLAGYAEASVGLRERRSGHDPGAVADRSGGAAHRRWASISCCGTSPRCSARWRPRRRRLLQGIGEAMLCALPSARDRSCAQREDTGRPVPASSAARDWAGAADHAPTVRWSPRIGKAAGGGDSTLTLGTTPRAWLAKIIFCLSVARIVRGRAPGGREHRP